MYDFEIWDQDTKYEMYKFITIPEDDSRVDISNSNGFKIISGTVDSEAKTATIEFIRPFDVSSDEALTLYGGA